MKIIPEIFHLECGEVTEPLFLFFYRGNIIGQHPYASEGGACLRCSGTCENKLCRKYQVSLVQCEKLLLIFNQTKSSNFSPAHFKDVKILIRNQHGY